MLIGEPGVGKTAIVEGLAQRIIRGDVPESLKDRRVVRGETLGEPQYRLANTDDWDSGEKISVAHEPCTGARAPLIQGSENLGLMKEVSKYAEQIAEIAGRLFLIDCHLRADGFRFKLTRARAGA